MCAFGVLWLLCAAPAAPKPSHDNQRAQTCTFEGPGLQTHHQNSTRRHPEGDKSKNGGAGEGRKRAKFWAVGKRAVRRRVVLCGEGRGVRRKVVQGSPNQQQPQQPQPQQRQTQNQWVPARSPKQGLGWAQQHTTNTTTHDKFRHDKFRQNIKTPKLAKVGQNSKTLKLAKVGLAKVGQDLRWPNRSKLAKVGLAKVGQDLRWPNRSKLTKVGLAKVGMTQESPQLLQGRVSVGALCWRAVLRGPSLIVVVGARPVPNVGADVPSVHDVLRKARFV